MSPKHAHEQREARPLPQAEPQGDSGEESAGRGKTSLRQMSSPSTSWHVGPGACKSMEGDEEGACKGASGFEKGGSLSQNDPLKTQSEGE